jgi:hypothetical protein
LGRLKSEVAQSNALIHAGAAFAWQAGETSSRATQNMTMTPRVARLGVGRLKRCSPKQRH